MKYFQIVIFVFLIAEILSAPVSEEDKAIVETEDAIEDSAEADKIREKKSPGCTNCGGYGHGSSGSGSYAAPSGYASPSYSSSSGYSAPIVAPASTYSAPASSGSYAHSAPASYSGPSSGSYSAPAQSSYQAPAPIQYSAPSKPSYGGGNSYSSGPSSYAVPSHSSGSGYSSGHGSQYSSNSYGGSAGGYREMSRQMEQNPAAQSVGSVYGGGSYGGQQAYGGRPAYQAPPVHCGSNLLFGCAPRVQQVPCIPSSGYSTPAGYY